MQSDVSRPNNDANEFKQSNVSTPNNTAMKPHIAMAKPVILPVDSVRAARHDQDESKHSTDTSLSDDSLESFSDISGKCAWSICCLEPAANDSFYDYAVTKRAEFTATPGKPWGDMWRFFETLPVPSLAMKWKQSLYLGLFKKDDQRRNIKREENYANGGFWSLNFTPAIQKESADEINTLYMRLLSSLQFNSFVHPEHLYGLVICMPEGGNKGGYFELWVKDSSAKEITQEIGKHFEQTCPDELRRKCIIGFKPFSSSVDAPPGYEEFFGHSFTRGRRSRKFNPYTRVDASDEDALLNATVDDVMAQMFEQEQHDLNQAFKERLAKQERQRIQFTKTLELECEAKSYQYQRENQKLRDKVAEQSSTIEDLTANKLKTVEAVSSALSSSSAFAKKLSAQLLEKEKAIVEKQKTIDILKAKFSRRRPSLEQE